MTVGTYEDFFAVLRMRESSGDYKAVNRWDGSLGAYQFQEIALRDIGWYQWDGTAANDFAGNWTAKAHAYGVYSRADFLNNPAAQDAAMADWAAKLWGYISGEFGLTAYIGTVINGMELTPTALIGGAHLVGIVALADYIKSGGAKDYRDPYGTAVSEYIRLFSSYDSPYGGPGEDPTAPLPEVVYPDVPNYVLLPDGSLVKNIDQTIKGKNVALTLEGHSEPGSFISIKDGNATVRTVVADETGNWKIGLPSAKILKQYVIAVSDQAGAETSQTSLYVGSNGVDVIRGSGASDIIVGSAGNDVLTGGGGADTFVFLGRFGKDTITDFGSGDVIVFDNKVVSSAADVFKHASQVGTDTLIVLGSDSVLLKNVQLSNLTNEDFRFA